MRNYDAKKYLNSWKKVFFSLTIHRKPSFSVFSLFKLIQFVCLVMEWKCINSFKTYIDT